MGLIASIRGAFGHSVREEHVLQRHHEYLDGRLAALQATALDLHSTLHARLYVACVDIAMTHTTLAQLRFTLQHHRQCDESRECMCRSQLSTQTFADFCRQEDVVLLSRQALALEFETEFVSGDVIDQAMEYALQHAATPGLPPLILLSYQGDVILTFDVAN